MFEIGNYVVHVGEGICEISDITMMNVSGADRKYYVLIPIEEKSAKVYIPVDNAEKRVRPVMEKEDARKLIKEIKAVDETLVENEREREKIYKEAISSCDPRCLIGIMKTMYLRRQKRLESGKKSTAMDDRYFKLAEKHLYSELALVLEVSKEEVEQMIEANVDGGLT